MYANNVKSIAKSLPTAGPSRLFHSISTLRAEASAAPARKQQRNPTPHKYKPRTRPPPHEGIQRTADIITGNVIKRAARTRNPSDWKHIPERNAEEKRLKAKLETNTTGPKLPSAEKRNFFMLEDVDEDAILDPGVGSDTLGVWSQLQPGAFVELRRNDVVAHAVVLGTMVTDGLNRIVSLGTTGEIWTTLPEDVLFVVPGFIDPAITTRCGVIPAAQNEHEIAARVKVLKHIRGLDKQIEDEYFEVASHARSAYETFRSPDPDAWAQITTMEVTKMVTGGKSPSLVTLLAVHKHLMRRSQEFVAAIAHFRALNMFWVRPLNQSNEIKAIEELLRTRPEALDGFVEKAKSIVATTKAKRNLTFSEPPSQQPSQGPSFNEDDELLIRFLEHSIRSKRSIQGDPYIVPLSVIMKKLSLYEGDVSDAMVSEFLVDLGVHSPWHEPVCANEQDLEFIKHGGNLRRALPQVVQSSSQVHRKLGLDDLYPHDLVEGIRHDFGDMPVYVVDDIRALELDDGLSVESIPLEPGSYWVHVHVADPTSVLPPTHRIAQQALVQSSSFYFIHENIPMLPSIPGVVGLGEGSESGQPQKAMTFSFKINRYGDIGEYEIRPSLIRNLKVCKYDDVDSLLGLDPDRTFTFPFGGGSIRSFTPTNFSPTARKDLEALYEISLRLVRKRIESGSIITGISLAAMSMKSPEPGHLLPNPPSLSQRLDSTGFPEMVYAVATSKSAEFGSRRMVAECMKSAARVASRFFRDRGIPAVRRSAGKIFTTEADFQALLEERDEDGFVQYTDTVKRNVTYPQAVYSLEPHGHWQLGIPEGEGYCRVTSPLRRFGDMVAHWQIKHALLSPYAKHLFSDEWLKAFCVDMAVRDLRIRKLGKMHNISWAAKFLSRWMEYPALRTAIPEDPMENLIAVRIGTSRHNSVEGSYMCQVHISSLGLSCILTDLKGQNDLEVGQAVPVKIKAIRTGLKPLIWVSLK